MAGSICCLITTGYITFNSSSRFKPNFKKRYMQPAEILEAGIIDDNTHIYLIGIVKPGTLTIIPGTQDHTFTITDFIHDITVHFTGILPASFREGETARIEGEFVDEYNPTTFLGNYIMAAHDSEPTKNIYQPRSKNILVNNKSVL